MKNINKRYAFPPKDGQIELEYAPIKFKDGTNIIIPKQNDDHFYKERGYYIVIDNIPSYNNITQTVSFLRWNVNELNKTITSVYVIKQIENSNLVKKYSKLKITLFCIENNIWENVKSYLIKIGYYDLFVMAVYFLETDEYFVKGLESFKRAYIDENRTEQEIDELIENMKNFAYDGYVIVDEKSQIINIENNQNQIMFSSKPQKESWFKKFKSDILNKIKF